MTSRAPHAAPLDAREPWVAVDLAHAAGVTRARHYDAGDADAGVVLVGGVGGGWDSPARDLYARLAAVLPAAGAHAFRVRYRHPTDLDACVTDVDAGLGFLHARGVTRVALVGHSLGGAVVIRAAVVNRLVTRAVIALATQAFGAEGARELAPSCALLLVHGTRDRVLPAACSETVFDLAGEPKRLVRVNAGHVMDEAAGDVEREVRAWLREHLRVRV